MLSIKNLSIQYENVIAVKNISYDFNSGIINGLIGPNGAGKSSLLKACVGLINDYQGKIIYDEKELGKNRTWVKKQCGYAPEDAVLFPYLTGEEFLQLIASIRNNKQEDLTNEVSFFLQLTGLTAKMDELIVNYSHGMRQKLAIAAALIGEPEFIIIDESLNGLDPIALYNLKKYFNELIKSDKTIILSSHILPLIRDWCHIIVIMDKGALIQEYSKDEILKYEKDRGNSFETLFLETIKTP